MPRHAVVFYFKNLLPSIVLNIVLQLVSAAIFVAVEPGLGIFDAFYHCIVTATTVGYGDVSLTTQEARLWACFHILVSVVMLGELMKTMAELRSKRIAMMMRISQLKRRLDESLLANLLRVGAA